MLQTAGQRLHLSRHAADAIHLGGHVLYLAQLYAEAPQLHLRVYTPHEHQLALIVPGSQVAGMIHLFVAIQKYSRREALGSKIVPMPIALGNLAAHETKLSGNTLRQQLAILVADHRQRVGHRSSDRNIHIPVLVDDMKRGTNRKLSRTITIIESGGSLLDGHELFTT